MKQIIGRVRSGAAVMYNKMHWFSDEDAWALFRLFAFTEAIGWTLLISAILYRRFDMPLSDMVVRIAGTIHGIFFTLYFVFAILTARSMMWSFKRVAAALLAGMPPYTALVFEKAVAHQRKKHPVYIAPPAEYDI